MLEGKEWNDGGMKTLIRIIITGAAIWLATWLLPGMELVGADGSWPTVGVLAVTAIVFGLVNVFVKSIIKVLAFPLYILTLGLLALVVNALMLMLASWLTGFLPWGFTIDNFGTAVLGALVIGIATFLLNIFFGVPARTASKAVSRR